MANAESVRQLLEGMPDVMCYLIEASPTGKNPRPWVAEHLQYMRDLDRRGVLLASGPLVDEGDTNSGGGIAILRVSDRATAERIAIAEPYVRHGVRTVRILGWRLRQGTLSTL